MRVAELLEEAGIAGIDEPLGRYVTAQRWFGGRGRTVTGSRVTDAGVLGRDPTVLHLVVRAEYAGGGADLYNVPVGVTPAPAALDGPPIATLASPRGELVVHDALHAGATALALWAALSRGGDIATCEGRLTMSATGLPLRDRRAEEVRLVGGEQSNTSLNWDDTEFLKFIRRVEPGPSIELEMARALDLGGFRHHAPVLASIEYDRGDGAAASPVAVVQPFQPGARDGWTLAAEALGRAGPSGSLPLIEELGRLGTVTAEMHLALASPGLPPAMAARPATADVLAGWADEMTGHLDSVLTSAAHRAADRMTGRLASIVGSAGMADLSRIRHDIQADIDAIRRLPSGGLATRVHGDLHLGQVVLSRGDWTVLDFEGEPRRPPDQRRALSSPLRDVAGMLRSFDYVAATTAGAGGRPTGGAGAWVAAVSDRFWSAYRERAAAGGILPPDLSAALTLRRAFEIDKAVYELDYELAHRPEWVEIPLRFLASRYH